MRKTRRIELFLLIVTISSVVISSGYAQQAKTYLNKRLNYSIDYPSNYELKPVGDIIVFVSPHKDKKFAFSANVNVVSRTLDQAPLNLKEFCQQGKDKILKIYGNAEFLEEGEDKLDGRQAYKIVYATKQNKADFKIAEIALINRNMVYIITYTSLFEEYDKYLKEAKLIINSFKILE